MNRNNWCLYFSVRLLFLQFHFVVFRVFEFHHAICPCYVHPLIPHFYIVKLGFAGVYIIFLFWLYNIDCGYSLTEAVLTCTHNLCFVGTR